MNNELATAIGAAILGVIAAFLITDKLILGEIDNVTIKTIDSKVNINLANPDPEIFNYKALNPTIEVYVGDCIEYNSVGECVETSSNESDIIDLDVNSEVKETDTESENTKNTENSSGNTNSSSNTNSNNNNSSSTRPTTRENQ